MDFKINFTNSRFHEYLDFLKASGASQSTLDRKLSSLNSFQNFLIKKNYLTKPNSDDNNFNNKIILLSRSEESQNISLNPNNRNFLKKIFKPVQNNNFLSRYLIFGTLIAIILGLTYGLYSQAISKAKSELAYSTATATVRAGRVLSFQGRLTDSVGNPITASTNITFKFFNSSIGGSELYNSSVGNSQVVVPDENGIFSVVIGKTHGTEIPSSVFSENAEVWLEITAGGETMSPRQQIATVAYALNSETLQGLPPSASGLKDTVLVIDGQGNLNLGETSPTIKSTSGTMAIEGQALLLKASDGSGGNITINPDGNGTIRFLTEGTSPSSGGFIDLSNANIAGGNLINSQINNDNRGYNFFSFQNYDIGTTNLQTRFSVGASGNVYISNSLSMGSTLLATNLNANYLNGYSYNNLPYDNYQYWQLQTNGTGTTNINSQSLVNLISGTGISLSQTGSNITINSSGGIGTTYAATNGLNLNSGNFGLGGTLVQNTSINLNNHDLSFIGSGNFNLNSSNLILTGAKADITANSGGDTVFATRISGDSFDRATIDSWGNYLTLGGIFSNNFSAKDSTNNISFLLPNSGKNLNFRDSSNTNTLISFTGDGNVGIGTTSPTQKLDINGSINIGGSMAIGSSQLVTNLNSDLLDGQHSNYFINIGQTDSFIQSLTQGVGISINGTGIGRTIAVNFNSTNLKISSSQLNTIQDITATSNPTFAKLGLGNTSSVYTLNVIGNGYFSTALTIGTSLNVGTNLTVGGTFTGVGSTNLVTNLNANYLNGHADSYFVNVGQTNVFIQNITSGTGISITGTGIGRTIAVNYGSGLSNSGSQLINSGIIDTTNTTLSKSGSLGSYTLGLNLGSTNTWTALQTFSNNFAVGSSALITNLNANYLNGYSYNNLPYESPLTFNNGLTRSSNTIGLGGTLTQNTSINTNNFNINIGQGDTQALFITSEGNIGIGDTNPLAKLVVNGDAIIDKINFSSNYLYSNSDDFHIIGGGSQDSRNEIILGNNYYGISINADTSSAQNIVLDTRSNGGYILLNNANVGLGTSSPTKKLDIVGDINLTGTIFANGTTGSSNQVLASNGSGALQWISAGGVGTTYSAGIGLTLSNTNVFSLNLGSTNTWTVLQTFGAGVGVTGNLNVGGTGTFTNLATGSTALVTNLNADLLDGQHSSYYLNIGQTGSFIQSLTQGVGISLDGTGIGRTIAVNFNATNLKITSSQLNTIQDITTTSNPTFAKLGLGSTSSAYTLNVVGNGNFSTSLSVGTSLITTNLFTSNYAGIGTTGSLNATLTLENTSENSIRFTDSSSLKAIIGVSAGNNQITEGSVDNDLVIRSQSNRILFTANGGAATAMSVSDTNIGIGTTNPLQKLDVVGAGNFSIGLTTPQLQLTAANGTTPLLIGSSTLVTNLNSQYLNGIPSSGYLTDLSAGIGITIDGTNSLRTIAFDSTQITNTTFGNGSTFTWTFNTGATNPFINFNDSGNIGIGTSSSPRTALEVNGTVAAQKFVDLTSYDQYFMDLANSDYNSSSLALDRRGSIKWNAKYNSGWQIIDNGIASKIESLTNGLLLSTSIGTTTSGSSITSWNQNLFLATSGYVGIGTTSPTGPFQINIGNTQALFVSSSGNVGIGTSTPSSKLEIAGSTSTISNSSGDITINAASGFISLNSNILTNLSQIRAASGTAAVPAYSFSTDTNSGMYSSGSDYLYLATAGTSRLTINSSGYVGIGTTDPQQQLHIYTTTGNANLRLQGNSSSEYMDVFSGSLTQGLWGGNLPLVFATNYTEKMRIDTSGYVGIGTTSPFAYLLKAGGGLEISNVNGGELVLSKGTSAAASFYINSDNNLALNIKNGSSASINAFNIASNSGYIGIGTTSPSAILDIAATGAGTELLRFDFERPWSFYQKNSGATSYLELKTLSGNKNFEISDYNGNNIATFYANGTASSNAVGIGTTSPKRMLDIGSSIIHMVSMEGTGSSTPSFSYNGDFAIGSIGTTGTTSGRIWLRSNGKTYRFISDSNVADYSEYFYQGNSTSEEGDLMVYDSTSNNPITDTAMVKKSSIPYDPQLIGVVSNQERGTSYNNDNDNRQSDSHFTNIGLLGHVWTKVSTINGPISVGDPLTTSSIPGVAMKATESGYIIGTAVSNYNATNSSQTGKIMVYVNPAWRNADINVADNGQINVNFNVSDEVLASLGYSGTKNEIENATYSLTDSTGKIINTVARFAQITTAKITAGLVSAKNIIVDNLAAKKIASQTIITGDITATTATISGDLIAKSIGASEASFSTVYANQIINPEGNISDVFAAKISNLRQELQNLIASNSATATPSAIAIAANTWDTSATTNSADLSIDNLSLSDNLTVGAILTVNGQTNLSSTHVSNILTVGQIAIQDNILETTADNLYFQPSGQGTIHFLNDRLVLASDGNVTINGNVKINGSLVANLLQADTIETKNLNTEKINIAVGETSSDASSSATLSSNSTAGTITLAAGQTEISVESSQLTSASMVYLTPNGSTQNQVPYVKNKSGVTFTIAIDQALNQDVNINWWLIN